MTPTLSQIRAALQIIAELPFFEITKEIDKPLRDVVPREYPSNNRERRDGEG